MFRYEQPKNWIKFDSKSIAQRLGEAKATILTLKSARIEEAWIKELQRMELRREVAGTSRIEGADFTERELDEALKESPEQLLTRSQRQAHAAVQTYRWIATVHDDRPIDGNLIREIHRRIVTGADDDHCPPGQLRKRDENVIFGIPPHRGVDGGANCKRAFDGLTAAIRTQFFEIDPLLRGLAAHYHLASMHPFLDGNGRTARALEALFLQRAGLRDACFIALSNYYYEEKIAYLAALSKAPLEGHDLTSFFNFSLNGVEIQGRRVLNEINDHTRQGP